MSGIPGEIVYLLIFAAVLLVRYLWQQRTRVQPWEEALARAPQPAEAPATPASEATLPPQPRAATHDRPRAATRPVPAPVPRPLREFGASASKTPQVYAVARSGRRFSRQTLFGDRRRTQDAVVAAVILGPCRSSSAYGADR
jgi:hypothetical protein